MSYDILFNQAVNLHEAGQLNEAEQIYRQILETAPEQPEVLNLLGLVAQAKGVQSEACGLFYRALKASPERPDFYYNLAFSFKLDNKPLEALEYFNKAAQLKPDTAEAYNEMALILEQTGDLVRARENWNKALVLNPQFSAAKANLARSFRAENDMLAIQELEQAGKIFPQEPLIWYYLSQFYVERNENEKAWSAASKAKELVPSSDEIRVILGQLSLREGKPENARIYFEKALLLNNRNIAALLASATLATDSEEYEIAETRFKRVLELDRGNFEAHHNYADLLYKMKRLPEALEEYRQAVIINPKSAEVSNNLGVILRDSGDLEQALGLFFNAFSLKPDLEEISVNLAETLTILAESNQDEAVKIAENWGKTAPDNVFATHTLNALKGEKSGDTQGYSERLFDNFADNYELVVKNIGYAVPMAMGRIAGIIKGSVVDLGCGTGLVGEVIKNSEVHLTGVDISQKMLDEAQKKGLYEALVKADAVQFLQEHPRFDWVFAADVAGYLGDLAPLVTAAKKSALLFSTEVYEGPEDYKLSVQGRYQHKSEYVENLLLKSGFDDVYKEQLVLRHENGNSVYGLIWRAK